MDLRHLRYFIAVAEEGSLTVAAEQRLHTAQPSLSRQMRDLEAELGCALMTRGVKGIELTAAGRVFLDHARGILLQVEAATEATRRAAAPAKASFVIGFLTGYEFDWLSAVMHIMRDALPTTEIVILSLASVDLADGLTRGKIDLAFMRHEKNAPGVVFTRLIDEPLIALIATDHALARKDAIAPDDIAGLPLIGVPYDKITRLASGHRCLWRETGYRPHARPLCRQPIDGDDTGRLNGRHRVDAALRAQPVAGDRHQQAIGRGGAGDRSIAGLQRSKQVADPDGDRSADRRTEIPRRMNPVYAPLSARAHGNLRNRLEPA